MRRKNITTRMMMGYITESLLTLMKEKDYREITVAEIAEAAGCNRSTYYRHFNEKDDIVKFYFDALMEKYQKRYAELSTDDFWLRLSTLFETFFQKKAELLLLYRQGLSHILLNVLMKRFRFDSIETEHKKEEQFEAAYHIGGIYNDMILWFSHDMKEGPHEMADLVTHYNPEDVLTKYLIN